MNSGSNGCNAAMADLRTRDAHGDQHEEPRENVRKEKVLFVICSWISDVVSR